MDKLECAIVLHFGDNAHMSHALAHRATVEEHQVAGLKLMLDSPLAELLVAELGGRPVGVCGLQLLVSTAQGAYSCHVEDLVLAPECRGRGIGRLLLEAAAEWAQRRGATRMQLNCDDKNLPAMKFYESLGWRKTHLFNYFKLDF